MQLGHLVQSPPNRRLCLQKLARPRYVHSSEDLPFPNLLCFPCLSVTNRPRSIWEVRSKKQVHHPKLQICEDDLTKHGQNFTYSKIQLWVALDRALRLSEKRCLPCPNRAEWLRTRDTIYEEIMTKGYNEEKKVHTHSTFFWRLVDSRHLSNRLKVGRCLIPRS